MGPRLRECCRQVEAELVSKSRNKIHQTWGPPIIGALYLRTTSSSSRDVIFVSLSRHRIRPSHNEIIWRRRRWWRRIAFCDDSQHYCYQISVPIKKLERVHRQEREGEKEQSRVGFSSPISRCRVVKRMTSRGLPHCKIGIEVGGKICRKKKLLILQP